MHGETIKIMNAKQAKLNNNYKNIKYRLLRTNAAIWYNKMCRMKQVKPGYIQVKIKGGRQRDNNKSDQPSHQVQNQPRAQIPLQEKTAHQQNIIQHIFGMCSPS